MQLQQAVQTTLLNMLNNSDGSTLVYLDHVGKSGYLLFLWCVECVI